MLGASANSVISGEFRFTSWWSTGGRLKKIFRACRTVAFSILVSSDGVPLKVGLPVAGTGVMGGAAKMLPSVFTAWASALANEFALDFNACTNRA